MGKTKEEKQEYHRKYYQQNIQQLQELSRKRYWRLKDNNEGLLESYSKRKKKDIEIKLLKKKSFYILINFINGFCRTRYVNHNNRGFIESCFEVVISKSMHEDRMLLLWL